MQRSDIGALTSSAASESVAKSRRISDEIYDLIGGVQKAAVHREIAAVALFQTALAHHRGLIALLENQAVISVATLLRPQWESYIRGSYLLSMPDEQTTEILSKRKPFPRFPEMLKAIGDGDPGSSLNEIHEANIELANSFTHGGSELILRIMNAGFPVFSDPEVVAFMNAADAVAILAATQIAELLGAEEIKSKLARLAQFAAATAPSPSAGNSAGKDCS